jgi:rod shape determining protein RodA
MQSLNRKGSFDFPLFFNALALWIIGIFLIYSATFVHTSGPLAMVTRNQIVWVSVAVMIIVLIVSVPNRWFYSLGYVIYGLSLVMLVYALFAGVVTKGASRWISMGAFHLQPSEFAKIGLLFALARYFTSREISLHRISSFIAPGIIILIPFILVLQQPDLGTALVFCVMAIPLFFWAGLSLFEVFLLISPGISLLLSAVPLILSFGSQEPLGVSGAIPWGVFFIILCGLLYYSRPSLLILVSVIAANLVTATITTVLWNSFLKDYQKRRIISFIDPQQDPFGAGYQVIQSKVAIGSGALFGKGYLKGTQTRLSFLPEQHTDFIFSVLGEQFGLMGCAVVLLLFVFLIVRGYLTTRTVRNRFSNLVIIGAVSILAFHIFINVAMTLGMMPVTGLPLPFLSYGGSFTLTVSILIGLILNAKLSPGD